MTQSATTSDVFSHPASSPVSSPRPEGQSSDCIAANGPMRGLIVGVCLAAPIWLLIGFIFYHFF
jgi:hypothetical protein